MPSNRDNTRPKRQAQFLDSLRSGQSVTAACADAGIDRKLVYEWRGRYEEFAKAWDAALEEGTDRMEDEAYRRAVSGTDKPVYQGGRHVGSVREYSDTLMIFLLKARRPDRYRERIEHTGKDGGPIEHRVHELSDDELARIAAGGSS